MRSKIRRDHRREDKELKYLFKMIAERGSARLSSRFLQTDDVKDKSSSSVVTIVAINPEVFTSHVVNGKSFCKIFLEWNCVPCSLAPVRRHPVIYKTINLNCR